MIQHTKLYPQKNRAAVTPMHLSSEIEFCAAHFIKLDVLAEFVKEQRFVVLHGIKPKVKYQEYNTETF